MGDLNVLLAEQLEAMHDAYAAKLPEKIRDLEETWDALSKNNWDLEGLTKLHRQAHTLAGSSATFGCIASSKAVRALELGVKKIMESGCPPTIEQRNQISQWLNSLKQSQPNSAH